MTPIQHIWSHRVDHLTAVQVFNFSLSNSDQWMTEEKSPAYVSSINTWTLSTHNDKLLSVRLFTVNNRTRLTIASLSSLHSPCLSNAMNSPDGLEFLCRIQHRFNKQNVRSFNQVEAVCTGMNRQQQNVDLTVGLEALQILLRLRHTQLVTIQYCKYNVVNFDMKAQTSTQEVSAVADEPTQTAVMPQCCTQQWMPSVINWRQSWAKLNWQHLW